MKLLPLGHGQLARKGLVPKSATLPSSRSWVPTCHCRSTGYRLPLETVYCPCLWDSCLQQRRREINSGLSTTSVPPAHSIEMHIQCLRGRRVAPECTVHTALPSWEQEKNALEHHLALCWEALTGTLWNIPVGSHVCCEKPKGSLIHVWLAVPVVRHCGVH